MKDYSNKILVAIGCSHVYGTFLNEDGVHYKQECHNRSWVKKLEKIANFKNSINLSLGGASNKRSFRVLKNFILDNMNQSNQFVVFFGITELVRTELPTVGRLEGLSFEKVNNYGFSLAGPWYVNVKLSNLVRKFFDVYFGIFNNNFYEVDQINDELISLHYFLEYLKIEHYFVPMLVVSETFENNKIRNQLPIISFDNNCAISFAKMHGYQVGKDIDNTSNCNHLDHDGNEFLANYIYNEIKGVPL